MAITAQKKLSDLKALLNDPSFDPNLVVDDETGMTLTDLRKSLKENQGAFTKATQKVADLERILTERDGQLRTAQDQVQQWQAYQQQLQAQAEAAKRAGGTEWRNDPLFAPLAAEFDRVTEINRQLATAYVGLLQQYNTDRQSLFGYMNKLEVDRIKAAHPDFDEEKVREVAKRYNVNDWEAAYKLQQAETLPAQIEEREKKAREDGMKAAEERLKAAPVTELGRGPVVGEHPGGGELAPSYDDAWKNLVPEMAKITGT